MKTAVLLCLTTLFLTACASADRREHPTVTSTASDIGTPSNWRGSAVTSPQM
ncbi:MAG: hypothetical protein WA771_16630 [Chthoniobacterales bacterium]